MSTGLKSSITILTDLAFHLLLYSQYRSHFKRLRCQEQYKAFTLFVLYYQASFLNLLKSKQHSLLSKSSHNALETSSNMIPPKRKLSQSKI